MEEKIKNIINRFEKGEIDLLDDDPDYEEREYMDAPTDHCIIHRVEEHIELVFEQHEHMKELQDQMSHAKEKHDLDKLKELEREWEYRNNEYSDEWNYNKVVGYRINGEEIIWL